ncbi:hypothetical protein QN375_00955 [Pseudomonas sp. MH9.2]|uniref:hypothetical protein n=1 Tax=unclassified Pseudomonas TaxID=196821 RepID=UPI002AC8ED4A|nr:MULTISPECIES: hypothetical protein [unclassified Pseudomonas]MEB0008953.1 hypothetical protein [Pseudomonas sp. RTB2]MEB0015420.1 hypothetical protein [Pseudomonas sp. RTB3]MEB0024367.1 hypothetical protein [Pseudomonas sp. MH9.2]MEB0149609.1 hypothetical protein [Pseudomonas sp. CCC2.2]MEB0272127.1 hypothetical protein [Pseudomonas sp. 5B4]
MSANPYATPQSALEVTQEDESAFFVVSITKLAIMFIMTSGLYYVYWSYKNWKIYKDSTGASIWPGARGLFNIFFVYVLFQRINQGIEHSGRHLAWFPKFRAIALIGLTLIGMGQGLLAGFGLSAAVSLVLLCAETYLLIGAQRAINYLEDDSRGESNARFTLLNYAWMLLGLCLWGFSVITLMGMRDLGIL